MKWFVLATLAFLLFTPHVHAQTLEPEPAAAEIVLWYWVMKQAPAAFPHASL